MYRYAVRCLLDGVPYASGCDSFSEAWYTAKKYRYKYAATMICIYRQYSESHIELEFLL